MKNLTYIISLLVVVSCSQPISVEDRQDNKEIDRYSIEDFKNVDLDEDSSYNIALTVDTIQGFTTYSLSFPEAEGKYSEQYYFNSVGNLVSYFFYNDFQERNPLLMKINLTNGLLDPDSIKIEGPPVCYRVQVTPTEEITYLKVASPTFLKGQIKCWRLRTKGEPVELVDDSISMFHSFWALGKKATYQTHESYKIITSLKMDKQNLIQDTLKL